MAEPFKNLFNPTMIGQIASHLQRCHGEFPADRFIALATDQLETLELKQRSLQIQAALNQTLPKDFPTACQLLINSLHPQQDAELSEMQMDDQGIRGWAIMPMADWVAEHGLENIALSLDAMEAMTKQLSAEFAIRHFVVADQAQVLARATEWTTNNNEHIRRLASEGLRTRLPWGIRLQTFIEDPKPLLPILTALRDDPSEYVRRSVANNLNDIAKDHPKLIAKIAADWLKGEPSKNRQRLVKHACRTLIKQGHPATLQALGYGTPDVQVSSFSVSPGGCKVGESVEISLELKSTSTKPQPLIIDYIVHHQLANGKTSPKVFKWKTTDCAAGSSLSIRKKHSLKPITTRKYYSGVHKVELQINGETLASGQFNLSV